MTVCEKVTGSCSRRDVLRTLAGSALALAVLPACGAAPSADSATEADGGSPPDAGGPRCETTHGSDSQGWVAIKLADYPALLEIGGSAIVREQSKLLDLVIVRTSAECFAAVWHICTHGACEVAFTPDSNRVECPCHGSQFALDGSILRGPATRPLSAFPAVRDGDTLWIHRWQ